MYREHVIAAAVSDVDLQSLRVERYIPAFFLSIKTLRAELAEHLTVTSEGLLRSVSLRLV